MEELKSIIKEIQRDIARYEGMKQKAISHREWGEALCFDWTIAGLTKAIVRLQEIIRKGIE